MFFTTNSIYDDADITTDASCYLIEESKELI